MGRAAASRCRVLPIVLVGVAVRLRAAAARDRRSSPRPDSDFGGVLFYRSASTSWSRSASTSWSATPACSTSATSASTPSAPTRSAVLDLAARRTGRSVLALPVAIARRDGRRRDPRRADAAAARRLPRHRHARVRRDHPDHRHEHRVARRGRHQGHRTAASPPAASDELFEIPHLRGTGCRRARPRHTTTFLVFGVLDAIPYYWLVLTVAHHRAGRRRGWSSASRVGRAWEAIREDEDAAELMGVPTFKFKLLAFAIGAVDRRPGRRAFASGQAASSTRTASRCSSRSCSSPRSSRRRGQPLGRRSSARVLVAYLPERFRGFEPTARLLVFGVALVLIDDLPARRACCPTAGGRRARRCRPTRPSIEAARGRGADRCLSRRPTSRRHEAERCSRSTTSRIRFGGVTALDHVDLRHPARARSSA